MANLTVWKFDAPDEAERAYGLLQGLAKEHLVSITDAAVVSWPAGRRKPKTRQLVHATGVNALDGAFWGSLFGLAFFMPFVGMALGAAMGALSGHFTDCGIDDDFIATVRSQVTEGTSALFLLTDAATPDKVAEAAKRAGLHAHLLQSNLTREQEAKLREVYGA